MIETITIALVVFLAAVLAMALGVIFGRRCIRGSCGGLANLRGRSGIHRCESCAHTAEEPTSDEVPDGTTRPNAAERREAAAAAREQGPV